MKRLFILCTAALALSLSAGCLFSKKNKKAKESAAVASDVEATFKQRWLDRRVGELTTAGIAPDAARQQAESEFQERFVYLRSQKK